VDKMEKIMENVVDGIGGVEIEKLETGD